MKKTIKYNIGLFLTLILFSIFLPTTFASEFYFTVLSKNVLIGEVFKVDLNINTQKESINATDGRIIFPTEYLELVEIKNSNSIVNFWIDNPVYRDGGIVFSGITPNGYVLDEGLILSFVFKAKKEGSARVEIQNASALKNDGYGTRSILKTFDTTINISGITQKNPEKTPTTIDEEAPDVFKPEIAKDPDLFDDKWFVVFVAQDKGLGIEKYSVKESKYRFFSFSKWVDDAKSPYLLTDQKLNSYIFIKATDKNDNSRVVVLSPKNPVSWYKNFQNWLAIVPVAMFTLTNYIVDYISNNILKYLNMSSLWNYLDTKWKNITNSKLSTQTLLEQENKLAEDAQEQMKINTGDNLEVMGFLENIKRIFSNDSRVFIKATEKNESPRAAELTSVDSVSWYKNFVNWLSNIRAIISKLISSLLSYINNGLNKYSEFINESLFKKTNNPNQFVKSFENQIKVYTGNNLEFIDFVNSLKESFKNDSNIFVRM